MTTKEFMLNLIPPETRKSENMNILFEALANFFDWYTEDIKSKSNYTIIEDLYSKRLELYGARFGVARVENWLDVDLRKRIKMMWHVYNPEINILDNLSYQLTSSSGYISEVKKSDSGISGEIDCTIVVPQGDNTSPFEDLDDFWVFGCKIYVTFSESGEVFAYDSFGDFGNEKYDTGKDPLVITFKNI